MEINRWRESAANNNAAVPDGAPEGWTGSQVNDTLREQMAALYRWYQAPEWLEITFGLTSYGAKTFTKLSDTQFRIASCDARTTVSGSSGYSVGRRVRLVLSGFNYDGFITARSFTAGNTDVTVLLDAAAVVPATIDSSYVHSGLGLAKVAFLNDPENIDDTSGSAAEQDAVQSPGTYASRTLATDLEDELQQGRYSISRLAVGVGATRNSGASIAGWIEKPARGQSRVLNGRFAAWSGTALAAPTSWTKVGTPTTLETVARATAAGLGRECHVVVDAVGEGISQAISGLKASSLYLVRAVARATTGAPVLSTTGGSGAVWGNFSAVIATAADAEYLGVILTDAMTASITLKALSAGNTDVFYVSEFDLIPLGDAPRPGIELPIVLPTQYASKATSETIVVGSWAAPTGLQAGQIQIPGPGYEILVRARVTGAPASGSNSTCGVRIEQSFNGGGFTSGFATAAMSPNDSDRAATAVVEYVADAPAVGTFAYRVTVQPVTQSYNISPSVATLGQLTSEITVEARYRG